MHFIAVGHGPVAFGEIADRMDRRDITVHGIEALEDDQFWPRWIHGREQLFEVTEIIVAPDFLFAARLAHTFDHGIVVECIRQQQTVRQQLGDGGNAGFVRYVT